MNRRKWMLSTVLTLLILTISLSFCLLAGPYKGLAATTSKQKAERRIAIQGKIYFNKDTNGYVVERKDPFYIYIILNQDKAALEKLEKEGRFMKIVGTQPHGADFLFLETVDGKTYP